MSGWASSLSSSPISSSRFPLTSSQAPPGAKENRNARIRTQLRCVGTKLGKNLSSSGRDIWPEISRRRLGFSRASEVVASRNPTILSLTVVTNLLFFLEGVFKDIRT